MQKVNDIYEHNKCLYHIPADIYERTLAIFEWGNEAMFEYNGFKYVMYITKEEVEEIEKKLKITVDYIGKYVITTGTPRTVLYIDTAKIAMDNIDMLVNATDVFDTKAEADTFLHHQIKRDLIKVMVEQSKNAKTTNIKPAVIKWLNHWITTHKSKTRLFLLKDGYLLSTNDLAQHLIDKDVEKTKENLKYRAKHGFMERLNKNR